MPRALVYDASLATVAERTGITPEGSKSITPDQQTIQVLEAQEIEREKKYFKISAFNVGA